MRGSVVLRRAANWSSIVSDAERLVGYSGSYLSLRYLLSDEMATVALSARKLIGTKHPLLGTVRQVLRNGENPIQTRGLVVLLVSQAGQSSPCSVNEK